MLIADPKTGEYHSPAPGEIKKNPDLANTFKSIAAHGKKGYYEGRIAEAIVERTLTCCPSTATRDSYQACFPQ